MIDSIEICKARIQRLTIEGVPTAIVAVRKSHGGEALFIHAIDKPCPVHGNDWLLFDIRQIVKINQSKWIKEFKAVDGICPRKSRLQEVVRLLIERDQNQHDVFKRIFCAQW